MTKEELQKSKEADAIYESDNDIYTDRKADKFSFQNSAKRSSEQIASMQTRNVI